VIGQNDAGTGRSGSEQRSTRETGLYDRMSRGSPDALPAVEIDPSDAAPPGVLDGVGHALDAAPVTG